MGRFRTFFRISPSEQPQWCFRWAERWLLCCCLLLLLIGPGCGKTEGPVRKVHDARLVLWNTMTTAETACLESLVEEFSKANPGIRVRVENVHFDKARQKFIQSMKGGVAPDIIRVDRFWIPEFVSQSLLEPLDGCFAGADLEDLHPMARAAVTLDGQIYGFPLSIDCLALFYNKQHFRELGLEPPDDLDHFRSAAKALTDADRGRWGFFLNPDGWWFEPFLFAFGGRYFSPTGEYNLSSDQTLKAIHFLVDLKDTEKALPPVNLRNNVYDTMMQSFKMGQVSMILNGPWAIRDLLTGAVFRTDGNLGVAPVPKGPFGRHSPVGCQSLAISKGSANKEAALLLVRYLSTSAAQAAFAKSSFGLPSRRSLFSDPELKRDPYLNSFILQMQTIKLTESHPRQGQLYGPVGEQLMKVMNNDISPENALRDLEASWKTLK